jgi:hypothetical protein
MLRNTVSAIIVALREDTDFRHGGGPGGRPSDGFKVSIKGEGRVYKRQLVASLR